MKALIFGEVLIDEYPDGRVVAGAPLHVAVHLVDLGWEAFLISRVGRDNDAEWIFETLSAHGVPDDLVEVDDDLPTGTATVELGVAGPEFVLHSPVAWDAIKGPDLIPEHDVLYFGSLAGRDPRSRRTLERMSALSQAPTKLFDVNLRPPHVNGEVLAHGLAEATVVKVNDTEYEEVPQVLDFEPSTRGYFKLGRRLEWLCVTRGPDGATLYDRAGDAWEVGPATVEVVDTVGAGDAFTAGLLDGIYRGMDPGDILGAAQDRAASTLAHRGGLPEPPG